ncbi:MAG TPA: HNH endonuclease signature motif containing protein [Gemmatimonadales bacterium]
MASRRRRGGKTTATPASAAGDGSNGTSTSTSPRGSSLRRSPGRSYGAHRDWLLERHGAVCAYCGTRVPADTITLDHVRPRRGQSAYDRPDNLVLACRTCNAAKADTPLLAFLMARRSRGVYLLHYGDHLSDPLKELARNASERPLLPPG